MSDKRSSQDLPGSEPEETKSTADSPESSRVGSQHRTTDSSSAVAGSDDTIEPKVYFTIDDAVNAGGYGRFQMLLTFLAGLGWLADAFEVIILSIIGDLLACEWEIKRWQNAVLTSVVFFGMTIGAPAFGNFADRFGRRTSLAISMLLLFIFGASSAAAPDYTWMVALRGLMGFALGGIAQGVTLCCEYYPANRRGRAGFYLSMWWATGAICVVGAAWIIMKHMDNWRVFVFIAAVPALIVFLSMKWYPESARYYLVSNQRDKALKTLDKLMAMNKAEMPVGTLAIMDHRTERGKIMDLLKPRMRRTTLIFWYMWLAIACAYYGIALMTPIIVTNDSLVAASRNRSMTEDFFQPMPCIKYSNQQFFDLLWTTSAELPGLILFAFTVECCPRKVFLGTTMLMLAFMILFLMVEMRPRIAMYIVLFICRALVASVFQLLFITTTESFPTTLRASAMGTGSGWARFGGLIIPFLAQVTVISSPYISIFVLAGITALAAVLAFWLPTDTRGKPMAEYVENEEDLTAI